MTVEVKSALWQFTGLVLIAAAILSHGFISRKPSGFEVSQVHGVKLVVDHDKQIVHLCDPNDFNWRCRTVSLKELPNAPIVRIQQEQAEAKKDATLREAKMKASEARWQRLMEKSAGSAKPSP